jgi:hypothetical protein
MNGYVLRQGILYDYEVGEPERILTTHPFSLFEDYKCHAEGMQYILLALVYFGGIPIIIHVARSSDQKGVRLYGKI